MNSLLLRLAGAVFPDDVELKLRFYQGICLLIGVFGIFVVVPVNAFQNLPAIVSAGSFLLGALGFGFYVLALRGRYYPWTLYTAILSTLVIGWFPNAASAGSIAFYFFPALVYPVLLFDGWPRRVAVAVNLALGTVLIWLDYQLPWLATPFQRPVDRALDLASGFLVSGLSCVATFYVVIEGYHRERQRLTETVSELAASREQIAQSRSLLRAILDNTDDTVWLVDPVTKGLVLYNAALVRSLRQYPGGEARPGLRPEDILPAAAAADWNRFFQRALDEGAFTVEYAVPGIDRIMLVSVYPVRHQGELLGIAAFGKDITERQRAEDERDRMAVQVLEAQKMESLGKLAGGVAHDFNNMLAGIMGHAELLMAEDDDPRRLSQLEAIVQAASRSSDLARKLLAFARRGKNVVEAVEINLLARDCLAMLRPSFRPDVDVALGQGATSTVDGDPAQMNQLLVNLFMNANEAMPGGGTLAVRTTDERLEPAAASVLGIEPGDYVALAVSDTGVGMSEEVRSRIFEPFFTTKTAPDQAGTGLGLSTVYGIVQLHRGGIAVESAPGRGATFTVFLPRGVIRREAPKAAPPPEGGSGLILVVDDEPLLRGFAASALARLGYQVVTAEDGRDALRVFSERHAQLAGVILDLKMPTMGGADAFAAMRAIDASVPVLICSGYGDNEEAQGLIKQGARGLLAKPFGLAELARQLNVLRTS